jgi:hypothetical protein
VRNPFVHIILAASLVGCSTSGQLHSAKGDSGAARIEIVDHNTWLGEPFRHIRWKGENYGPKAFLGAARRNVHSLLLVNVSTDHTRCVAALATALAVPASFIDATTGKSVAIPPSTESVDDVCTIVYNIPHPALAAGQYYVAQTKAGLAFEGEPPITPKAFTEKLRALGASAIVVRKPSIGELLCFGAIATETKVKLLKVKIDGTLLPLTVGGGSVSKSCSI